MEGRGHLLDNLSCQPHDLAKTSFSESLLTFCCFGIRIQRPGKLPFNNSIFIDPLVIVNV